ncbi:putative bifunctional diguanylate cyclase/phosphodiesterase [Desulfopila aestuarii]|uniref:Diguanylate cyclase (GGDEF) domain-containing protein n=1 Tax=Desulfopila aestuarii DSM 18488 TaxID=1121416 RepID=A0A1M7Y873_9BACT|nr:EAL domain-containing protein [Desulfopila aestuarii]SHO48844.1 diguanylate cyclase (GGDEF) domain-containing protein [Desulfopila aestuarii DSM 18488]
MIHSIPERDKPLVLIIDDDLSMRLAMKAAMVRSGFEVVMAENGRDGIEMCTRREPNLVLLDVVMPEMDGFETCLAIRQLPSGEFTQILMVTGLDDVESTEKAFEAGADGFISKPINWVMLGHRGRYMLRAGKAFQELSKSRFRLEKTQQMAQLGNWEINLQTGEFSCSDEACRLLGLGDNQRPMSFEHFFLTVSAVERDEIKDRIEKAILERRSFRVPYRVSHPDGSQRYILNQGEVLFDDQQVAVIMLGAVQDITMQKLAEEEIKRLAFYDGLTGLSNRLFFMNQLEQEILYAKRKSTIFALLYLDLDQFKRVNDTFGHYVGDQLLKKIALDLQNCIRAADIASRFCDNDLEKLIARLGGDEFTIILTGVRKVEHVATVARRIVKELPKPYTIEGHEIAITTSVGISMYPADGKDPNILLKHADTAMYQAKKSGRNNYQFFRKELNAEVVERFSLERDISRALDRNEFILYYQPKIDLRSMGIVGAEALIRWNHPERGMVSPAKFIPIAEESGQIVGINRWVVKTAIEQWQKWISTGHVPGTVAVNMSGYQFAQQKVMNTVAEALELSGLDPEFLEIEITENILMQNISEAAAVLQQLKNMRVRIGIDDFGTGYSSLSYISSFKVDTIKIDRSFVMGCIEKPDNLVIIKTIIAMGQSLGIKVVAEGVETAEQLELIRQHGADMAQGYYFSKPVPPEEYIRLLDKKLY